MKEARVEKFLSQFAKWASARTNILAVALVGSYARGAARSDSDVDLVVLCADPAPYLSDVRWITQFGEVQCYQAEDYGKLTSIRVWYTSGLEVEYGITDESWAAVPLDEGTQQVIADGMRVLFEGGNLLSQHQEHS